MVEYVILGTSDQIQDSSKFEKPLMEAIGKHSIRLVAEEYPCDNASMVCVTTKRLHIPYLQVDLYPEEWGAYKIDREMRKREQFLRGEDCRLSHADAVREGFWLEKIEASMDGGRVLTICGYLHLDFLARRVEERGSRVVKMSTFPPDLCDRKATIVLTPAELEEYLKKQGAAGKWDRGL
jgi:hypothetical protein